jgi:homogentisate 1,2-dioxygenase
MIMDSELKYQSGFGNHFETEALVGALPPYQNSPQKPPYGLYAEQLSGSAFTAIRHENQKTWFYRIRPSVLHDVFSPVPHEFLKSGPFSEETASPNQLRWDPLPAPSQPTDFIEGLRTMAGNGSVTQNSGCAAHLYFMNRPMTDRFFYNSDGELIFVPRSGEIKITTECGKLTVKPGEIAVVPRGMKFQASPATASAEGYLGENYGANLRLPSLGPIGANGLANPRHFLIPVASFEDRSGNFKLVTKFQGKLWEGKIAHSPFDVVAWAGNYAPYKYDLKLFNTMNTVSFDHPDPSIFTVLTSPSFVPGVANLDFVIFPARWMVAEKTFRPPYYHRNYMSELMGLIYGKYDAKPEGFSPGGLSLHNAMSAHGPDTEAFKMGTEAHLSPQYLGETLAFMFESNQVFVPTPLALSTPSRQKDYLGSWRGLKSHFDPTKR